MAITTNVPSNNFEDLQRDVQDATRFTNATAPFTNRVGQSITPIPVRDSQLAAKVAEAATAVEALGWFPVAGSFTDGGTIAARNQVLFNDADSSFYSWSGALPKVVPAASTPASTGGISANAWINRGDAALRSALAATGSTVPVGGVGAGDIANAGSNYKRNSLNSITRTIRERFDSQKVHVLDFVPEPHRAAINTGDYGAISSLEPISAAIDSAIVACGNGAYPLNRKTLWFDNGAWIINRPVILEGSYHVDGDNARLIAGPAWTGLTANKSGGGTEVISSLLIFLDGMLNDFSGALYWDSFVGKGISLFGSDSAQAGVFMERQLYAQINCRVEYTAGHGFDIGQQCWGLMFNQPVVENWVLDAIHLRENSAANGLVINSPQFWGRFKQPRSGVNFTDLSECNGVKITGGFIEKLNYGVLVGTGNGPIMIDGVDFEQCQLNVARVVGDMSGGRRVGEVKITNSFLHSIESSKVYCSNARVSVEGCRLFGSSQDFETADNPNSSITEKDNAYFNGSLNIGSSGSRVRSERTNGAGCEQLNYLSHKTADFVTTYAIKNYSYRDAPNFQSSGLSFVSYYVGGPTGQYVSYSDWYTTEYQHETAPGVANKVIGVRLANDAGQNALQPLLDNVTSLGGASARFTEVYAATGSINTSDERDKTELLEITDAEKAVALEIKQNIRKFKFIDSVNAKGEKARMHFGVGAQTVKAIFEKHGLNGFDYAVLCYDEWCDIIVDVPEEKDDEGNIIKEAETKVLRTAGDKYGIRYDQLCMFILASI